jgi:hypothetical protein
MIISGVIAMACDSRLEWSIAKRIIDGNLRMRLRTLRPIPKTL